MIKDVKVSGKKYSFGLSLSWQWVFVSLLVFLLLLKLGIWQINRAEQKEQRLQRIASLQSEQTSSLIELLARIKPNSKELLNDMPIAFDAYFDESTIILEDNQHFKGQLGYRVYQVASQEGFHFLINLGWVAGSKNRDVFPVLHPIKGRYQASGHIRFVESAMVLAEQAAVQKERMFRVQKIDVGNLEQVVGKPLLPFVVYLATDEELGYKKQWLPIVMPPEKHRGYAFQWFSLAFAWMALMIWAAYKAKNNNKV